jgi:hypothetical protein
LFQFYLDWRDCDYTEYYYGQNDIWLKYNATNNTVGIKPLGNSPYKNITSGSTWQLWKEKSKEMRIGIRNSDSLELNLNISFVNSHPVLSWAPVYPDPAYGYRVFKEYEDVSTQTTILETFNVSVTSWTDTDFYITSPITHLVRYWIRARIGATTLDSLSSNTVSAKGQQGVEKSVALKNELI